MSNFEDGLRELVDRLVDEKLAKLTKPDEYLSTRAAAKLADVTPDTIRRWVLRGKLAEHRAGRVVRISRQDLERLLRTGRRKRDDSKLSIKEQVARTFAAGDFR